MSTPNTDIPDDAVIVGASRIDDLLTMLGVDANERPEHGGPTIAEALTRTVLAAALPVLNTAKDSETATWIDVVIARLTAVGGPDVTGAVATLRSLAASLRGEQ